MCEYANLKSGMCEINNNKCPFVYFCTKKGTYKKHNAMPENCKIKKNFLIPKDSYEVCFERHGNLYIDVKGYVKVIKNPFNYIPAYVFLFKTKNGDFKIKKGGVYKKNG